ncbi:MAG: hypothetical protein COT71_04440 [Candidatus Andersenbacteria bacterium CG10_big_fil_rev_8_21_14_0_10_54_11]|uniref:Uncharacterized protein n=1 Tax=Candidatus Andersenbacteria bacterium CG10_big_fil_rev_8_21_14_0_10_54_11 TaxID=1974485 RepID=A0A2M6WY91_9BACT|nr:MAG: hypothetical protein COT71_04440 [Candidatus Andersenbacteria bacterium CG10_big_fil_rev_8_21_14_0_10_54_11]
MVISLLHQSFISGFLAGGLGTILFELALFLHPVLRRRVWDNPLTFRSIHVHHSIIGIFFIAAGTVRIILHSPGNLFLIGLGLGVIVVHTLNDGFVFIEKLEHQGRK